MDIIPLVLDENAAAKLPDEFISKLAECSTDLVKDRVIQYLKNPDANPIVKDKVAKAYSAQLDVMEYLTSETTRDNVELVKDLTYLSIGPELEEKELIAYRDAIKSILNDDRAVPYLSPVSGALIKDLKEEVKLYAKDAHDPDITAFSNNLQSHAFLFRDSSHAAFKGTVVKKIVKNNEVYDILLRGIDFILEKKAEQASPDSWRYL